MKKRFVFTFATIALILLTALVFTACGSNGAASDSSQTDDEKPANTAVTDVYTKLNEMLQHVAYPVTLRTKTTESGYPFYGTYVITDNDGTYSVEYSYERLSKFEFTDDGKIVAPDAFRTTYTGSIKVRDGKIVERQGAESNVSVEAFDVKGITLSKTTLANVQTGKGTFSADIPSLQKVTGMDVTAKNAKLTIAYDDSKINEMTLSFSTSAHQSEITYEFG